MQPRTDRPFMPGYGIAGADEGRGLLPWSWAEERLTVAHDYWVSTVRPDGRPHVTPVWGAWLDDAVWFSCGRGSRKARNLQADARCSIATDKASEPVLIDGDAEFITNLEVIARFLAATNTKYETDLGIAFLDPAVNATIRVRPQRAIGLTEVEFTTSPTRWTFEPRTFQ